MELLGIKSYNHRDLVPFPLYPHEEATAGLSCERRVRPQTMPEEKKDSDEVVEEVVLTPLEWVSTAAPMLRSRLAHLLRQAPPTPARLFKPFCPG